jgi:hypothetical protein
MIRGRLERQRGDPRFARLELRAAALVMETCLFADVPECERLAAVHLLRNRSSRLGAPEIARQWRQRGRQQTRPTFARHIAEIVADAALGDTYHDSSHELQRAR